MSVIWSGEVSVRYMEVAMYSKTIGNDLGPLPLVCIMKVSVIGGVHCQRLHYICNINVSHVCVSGPSLLTCIQV